MLEVERHQEDGYAAAPPGRLASSDGLADRATRRRFVANFAGHWGNGKGDTMECLRIVSVWLFIEEIEPGVFV